MLLASALLGCGDNHLALDGGPLKNLDGPDAPNDAFPSDAPAADVFPSDSAQGDRPLLFDAHVPATSGTLSVDFRLSVQSTGTARLGHIGVTSNAAHLELAGKTHTGIAYKHHVWAGYTLHDIVSVADDGSNLAVTYLYCQDSRLPYAYTESFLHPMDWEPTQGSCHGVEETWTAPVSLPSLHVAPAAQDTGITISGADIALGPTGGFVILRQTRWNLHPFATVDCSSCPGGPWYEIHSVLLAPEEACFTILYLFPITPDFVQLALTLCLPSLATPEAVYDAVWSGTLKTSRHSPRLRPAPLLHGVTEWHSGTVPYFVSPPSGG